MRRAFMRMKKKIEAKDGTHFTENGSLLLEWIASSNGKCNPIRNFSTIELKKATNDYHSCHLLHDDGACKFYEGSFQDIPICIKKFKDGRGLEFVFNDIVIASQMSIHKNVLKLLGCCLETEIPILVYEFPKHGSLAPSLYGRQPLTWKLRLKIAADIASMVAYLHTAFSRPIIHRGIKPSIVLLDQHHVAKLSDFSLCISIPDGESCVEYEGHGAVGVVAPEYKASGYLTEKTDVFAFGIFLLELLTGQRSFSIERLLNGHVVLSDHVKHCVENNRFSEIVDWRIQAEARWPGKDQQLQEIAVLALSCSAGMEVDRPTMTNVAKQLRQMEWSAAC